ncbi:Uncharacterised protein [BD1-7 clade bacterium]|uniref:Sulfotransferase domain-containing protein n=1 Tax=BD1-7 clade bacterium TaxID=2029982 RepID=A0A5S9QS06_9GAMM|nr:Uncharacterised protein [BD1-7 clade bacterium]CAA0121446.1 Uncharacterised protein [BD1-7 clade bacterium]
MDMTTESSNKIFILGVGGQKCGTTWLYHYLSSFAHVNMGFRKEYHIWDRKHSCLNFNQKHLWQLRRIRDFKQYLMTRVPGYYENYFSGLMKNGINTTGDITPSYAGLTAEAYTTIKQRLEAKGFEVKVVFLMRDPVQRCWSAQRMNARRNKRFKSLNMSDAELNAEFRKRIYNAGFVGRTRYENTIRNLEQVFKPDALYFGIYETMHEQENLEKLSAFCGVSVKAEFSEKVINRSPGRRLTVENTNACFEQFNSTYSYCYNRFPETQTHWQTRVLVESPSSDIEPKILQCC